jgi:amidase
LKQKLSKGETDMVDRRRFLLASGQLAAAATLAGKAFGRDATDDPAYLPANKLLTRFRERKLSPMDVLEAQIKRIETLNDKVNCIAFKHFDEAREAARESEKRYANGNPRPLEGIIANTFDDLSAFQLAASYARVSPPFFEGALFPDFRDQPVQKQ